MALYEITMETLHRVEPTTLGAQGFKERADLQRLLRQQVDIVSPDTMVIAEEFGDWDASRRRIDLLAIDKEANLVVIELKRTEDGGHVELQALRYAAMVSTMTFDQAVEAHAAYRARYGLAGDAQAAILDFLGSEADPSDFARRVRILLVAGNFDKEITTTVMWLNDRDLDIRCVRLIAYVLDGRTLVDVQQIIPLREAEEYQVRVRAKQQEERIALLTRRDLTKYDVTINGGTFSGLAKRNAVFRAVRGLCDQGVTPEAICKGISQQLGAVWAPKDLWFWVEGRLDATGFLHGAGTGGRPFDQRRWFLNDDQLIYSGDRTWALLNQWGTDTTKVLGALKAAFPEYGLAFQPSEA